MTKSADWRVALSELLPDPETQCGYCQKTIYESEREAKKAASKAITDFNRGGRRAFRGNHLYAYECPKGKGWHLTSQKPCQCSARTPKQRKPSRSISEKVRRKMNFLDGKLQKPRGEIT